MKPAQLIAAAFGVAYAVVGFFVFDPTSLLSVDAAIKLLQAKALVASHYASLAIPQMSGALDPSGTFLPFGAPFVFWSGGRLEGIFPSGVALLNSTMIWAGPRGVAALSVLSAVAILAAVAFIADDDVGPGAVVVLGLATPLWFYAILPWEHAPALALGMWALALGYRADRLGLLMLAGGLGGLAATLRDEHLVTLLVLVVLILVRCGWRRALAVAACGAAPTLLVAALDLWVFQRPPVAHLAHAVRPIAGFLPLEVVIPQRPSWTLAERYKTAVVDWLFGIWPELWQTSLVFLIALMSTFVVPRLRVEAVISVVVAVVVVHVGDLVTYLPEPGFVAGLFRLSPALLFAVLPLASGQSSSGLRRFAIATSASFGLVVLTFLNTDGGAQLGPRLLLPILPMLAIAAWEGLASYRRTARRSDRLIWWLGLVLVGGSVVMQVGVAGRAYYELNSAERQPVSWLRAAPESVLVIDAIHTMNIAVHDYGRRSILLSGSQRSAEQVALLLRREQVQSFLYISRRQSAAQVFPGYHRSSSRATTLTAFESWVVD